MAFFSDAVSWFLKGGPVMWPLLLCSLVLFWLGIERWLFYRAALSGPEFAEKFLALASGGQWPEARRLAQETKGEEAALALSIMDSDKSGARLEAFASAKAERAIGKFEEYISYIAVIVTLSPVLGLLGTITGMIASFDALDERMQNPMAVTAGISEALITTVFGLCISIVAICVHTWFSQKMKVASLNIEETANTLLGALTAKEASAAGDKKP
ncbi:MAG: MotA/TolQ/ExbB proton channel family protein [Acidaminococcales bacterium]|jgi:biopolymer transport protein ExbB|nr:MotA/TolQ/ExbB proton channel family protein [Acidaminococcales bacterium]